MERKSPMTQLTENIQVNILDYIPDDVRQFLYRGNSKAGRISINSKELKNVVANLIASFVKGTNPLDELSDDSKILIYAEATKALEGLFEPAEFFNLLNDTLMIIHTHKADTSRIKLHVQSLDKLNSSQMCLLLTVLKYCIAEVEKSDKNFSYSRILIDAELKFFIAEFQSVKNAKQKRPQVITDVSQQKETLTLSEAAVYLSMSESYLYKLTSNRTIEFSKPGGKVIYFNREVLDKFLLRNPVKHRMVIETEANTFITVPQPNKK